MLELHHWEPNGLFLKPLIALHEKGAAFTSRYFDASALEQFDEGFPTSTEASLHLEREGPILVADGTVLCSTFFMLEYISDAVPGVDLMRGSVYDRYRMRAWGQKIATILSPAVCALGSATYLAKTLARGDTTAFRAKIERIEPVERREVWLAVIDGRYDASTLNSMRAHVRLPITLMEDALARTPWLAGDHYSVADIDAYCMVKPLAVLAPDVVNADTTPAIMDFLARVTERGAVKQAMAMARTDHPESCFVPGCEASRWG
jgi:GSH-dependent disulfide-bond oxidoreductase